MAAFRVDRRTEWLASKAAYRAANRMLLRQRQRAYAIAHPELMRELGHRYRVRKRAGYVAPVRFNDIWERDRGICQICGEAVRNRCDANLDHILPIARG